MQFAFAYFAILDNLIGASALIYETDVSNTFFDKLADPHNMSVLLALWVGSVGVYLIDIQFWFVLASNIVAYMVSSQRGEGKVSAGFSLLVRRCATHGMLVHNREHSAALLGEPARHPHTSSMCSRRACSTN